MPVTRELVAGDCDAGARPGRVRPNFAITQARIFLIGISFCLGLLWSAGSAFVGLKLSGWLADKIHVAPWIIAAGFVVFWLAPAIAMAVGLLVQHPLSHPARTDWLAARIEEDLL